MEDEKEVKLDTSGEKAINICSHGEMGEPMKKPSLLKRIRWQRKLLLRDIKNAVEYYKARRLVKDSRNMVITINMQSLADFDLYIDPYIFKTIKKYKLDPDTLASYANGKTACLAFSPKTQKWYGWSHRALYGFKIGDIVEAGDCTASSGYTEEFIKENPEEGMRYVLPVGFEAKTLEDAKLMAIAFAASVS